MLRLRTAEGHIDNRECRNLINLIPPVFRHTMWESESWRKRFWGGDGFVKAGKLPRRGRTSLDRSVWPLNPHCLNPTLNFTSTDHTSPFVSAGNDVSRGRREGKGACLFKYHSLKWSWAKPRRRRGSLKCVLRLFPPWSLSRPTQPKTTGGANKHLYVRHHPDR